ncbi:MAG TPA: S41 family peptidase [Woeseiaceae bacterium]|nr:S41 family peptidase [Woeseiaceae bacterium]
MRRTYHHGRVRPRTLCNWSRILAAAVIAAGFISYSHAAERVEPKPRYAEVAAAINETIRAYHYDPAELDTPGYRRLEGAVMALGAAATSDEAFMAGFREIWKDGPFSHVTINVARQSADDLADYLDTIRVGGGGASLAWRGDVAVLTVNTMMGLDTIEEIDAAYAEIAEKGASGLVIDLRNNGGGAFAVRPLVSHLLARPFDAGSFVSRAWNAAHRGEPGRTDLEAVDPWEGWSIKAFWADVQSDPVTRIRFSPAKPGFDGPVYVLTSKRTASAAELATDALQAASRAIVVGENTAGEMLSQKIYDVPGGFHLGVPIADYYSLVNGRIEGVGIEPDIETDAADALDVALNQL